MPAPWRTLSAEKGLENMRHILCTHAMTGIGNINFFADDFYRNAARIGIAAGVAN